MREALLSHLVRIQPEIMFGERSKLLSHDKAFKRLWQINIFITVISKSLAFKTRQEINSDLEIGPA